MAKEPWEQDDDWEPENSFWQLEILGCDGYFHVDTDGMADIERQIDAAASDNRMITVTDTLGRPFKFPANKFSAACWCSPLTRDRIRRAEIVRNVEERDRTERLGSSEDKEW